MFLFFLLIDLILPFWFNRQCPFTQSWTALHTSSITVETAFSADLPVCLVALAGYCGKILFSNLSTVISYNASYSTLRDLRERVVEKLAKVPIGTILDTPSGHYKSIIVDRIEGMEVPFAHLLPEMTSNMLVPLFIYDCPPAERCSERRPNSCAE